MKKKCIKCKILLHPSDWLILKERSSMPICDNCLFTEEKCLSDHNSMHHDLQQKKVVIFQNKQK